MALVGERPASVGRPEGLVHKSTGPSRITPRTRPGHSFPSSNPPSAAALPCRHIVLLPVVRTASAPFRGCSRQNVAVPPTRSTTRPYSYPVRLAGARRPRDHDAQFGAVRRSGRRDPSEWTVPRSAANHACIRSHALPGFPEGPVGPSGCPVSSSQARDRTVPSGTSPAVTYLHSATSSFRASATIPRFRERPSRALT